MRCPSKSVHSAPYWSLDKLGCAFGIHWRHRSSKADEQRWAPPALYSKALELRLKLLLQQVIDLIKINDLVLEKWVTTLIMRLSLRSDYCWWGWHWWSSNRTVTDPLIADNTNMSGKRKTTSPSHRTSTHSASAKTQWKRRLMMAFASIVLQLVKTSWAQTTTELSSSSTTEDLKSIEAGNRSMCVVYRTLFEKSNFCPKIQFWQNSSILTSYTTKFFLHKFSREIKVVNC